MVTLHLFEHQGLVSFSFLSLIAPWRILRLSSLVTGLLFVTIEHAVAQNVVIVQAHEVINALTVGNGTILRNNRNIGEGHQDDHGLSIYISKVSDKSFQELVSCGL